VTGPRGGNHSGGNHSGGNHSASYDNAGHGSAALVLSLGSNLGDRLAYLQLGLDVLGSGGLDLQAVSSVYETDPVGGVDQADYLNAVLLAGSSLPPRDILARCATAESAAGRVRTQRWGPRTLDVDVIVYGTEVCADPALTLPHPRAHERAFVLVPWLEIDPHAVLPGFGPVASLLTAAPAAGTLTEAVRRRPDLRLTLPVPETDAPCS
jgi:2-amino-4-hydroxy-6-hydroxymethyldihydropteridine diphosphokinase